MSAVAAAAALVAGCTTVGPDYHLPENSVMRSPEANGPIAGNAQHAVSIAAVPDDWWQLYDDPKLDALVKEALAANTNVRVALANVRRAIAMYHEVESENLPQGGVEANAARAQLSGESFLQEEKLPVINLAAAALSVSYQIDFFGKLARADEAALAAAEASQAALDVARVSVAAETVRAYVQSCAANHEYDIASEQLQLQEKSVAITRKLVDAGRDQPTDLLRAQAQADTLRAALPHFQAQHEAATYRLAVMLGKVPGTLDASIAQCRRIPQLSQTLPVGDGTALLKRRPDVRQAERELASATAKIGVATADLYPSIRLGASIGASGVLEHFGQGRTEQWTVGPMITWSLPTNGVRAHIKGMEAGADAALAHFDGVVLKALQETQTSLSAYTRELQRDDALRDARDKSRAAAEQNHKLYRAGRAPYLTSLDAERTHANAEAALAASETQVAMDQVNLFLALGGGWQSSAANDKTSVAGSHSMAEHGGTNASPAPSAH
ncbi:efflux transporter outer membrane subunit [Pandoraea apista]|uniref:efflux transporter outer membrane subunit n=1 Tax=Pandoraea apista TaxID=93218 RepID=UPI00058AABAE|nr:efflux transporter outer membrane subunit [Pandoraea apista]AJE97336.1 RND transporter [Pandoraea apista]AKH71305.1 RND transporter [Pandoraea apista]AKI63577.1 RND transporter [Pandoraea apista]